jgi:hypothetical protein
LESTEILSHIMAYTRETETYYDSCWCRPFCVYGGDIQYIMVPTPSAAYNQCSHQLGILRGSGKVAQAPTLHHQSLNFILLSPVCLLEYLAVSLSCFMLAFQIPVKEFLLNSYF